MSTKFQQVYKQKLTSVQDKCFFHFSIILFDSVLPAKLPSNIHDHTHVTYKFDIDYFLSYVYDHTHLIMYLTKFDDEIHMIYMSTKFKHV